jgi:hypothetical protein
VPCHVYACERGFKNCINEIESAARVVDSAWIEADDVEDVIGDGSHPTRWGHHGRS